MATAMPRFTIMREDLSYVWAREYGDARDSTTILAALLAIGSAKRILVLSDDEDGVWTLTTDLAIPTNVTLSLPAGVTLTGTGNLTIEGNLLALRHDWWQSTGTWVWHLSSATWMAGKARMYTLALDAPLAITSGGTGASDVPQAQINLGIVPGTDVQPYDPTLTAFAASTGSANTFWFFTSTDVGALTPLTATARNLLDDPDAATMRGTLGLKALAILDTVNTPQITNEAVTFAKLQPMTDSRLLGRAGAGVGEISVGAGLALNSGVLSLVGGSVLGSGAANRAAFWTGVASQSYDDVYQYNPTTHVLTLPKAVLTDTGKALHIGPTAVETGVQHVTFRQVDTLNASSGTYISGLHVIQNATRTAISPTLVVGISTSLYLNQAGFAVSGSPVREATALEVVSLAMGTSGTISSLYGMDVYVGNQGAGHITNVEGISVRPGINTGTITHYAGIAVRTPPVVTGNAIGIYSEVNAGTNRWAFYAASTAASYFSGAVGIGVLVPTTPLHVAGIALAHTFGVQNRSGSNIPAFSGEIAATGGTNRWNLYITGDAPNLMNGWLGIGKNPTTPLDVVGRITGDTLWANTDVYTNVLHAGTYACEWRGASTYAIYVNDNPASVTGFLSLVTENAHNKYSIYCGGTAPVFFQGSVGFNTIPDLGVCATVYALRASRAGINFKQDANTGYAPYLNFSNAANGQVGYVICDATTTYYVTASDARLKDDIQPFPLALPVIQALRPVAFRWRNDDTPGYGFLAHEVQHVVPTAVQGESDAVDEHGTIRPQGIDPSKLVVWLTGAVQELAQQVTTLTNRLAALEAA